jgi:hypothetical protein
MTLSISISEEAEARLKSRAAACGQDVESYVANLVAHFADPPVPLEQISGPIYQNFLSSGMSDDELGDMLERAKHEARAERRARRNDRR